MMLIPAALITLAVGFCALGGGMLLNAGVFAHRGPTNAAPRSGTVLIAVGAVVMVAGVLLASAAIGFHVPDPSGHVFQY